MENSNYEIEELLGVVQMLSEKYTSFESSSITYEAANMLMEAAMYCINEANNSEVMSLINQGDRPNAMSAYKTGYDIVIDKVYRAKEVYEDMLGTYTDYGCMNYHDTIIEGMPQFFIRYDPKFKPQDHLLTLDYPLLHEIKGLCGIDLIYQYLHNLSIEISFLEVYDRAYVVKCLEETVPDYRELYFGNIVDAVLFGMISTIPDIRKSSIEETKKSITDAIKMIVNKAFSDDDNIDNKMMYFVKAAGGYAAIIQRRDSSGRM